MPIIEVRRDDDPPDARRVPYARASPVTVGEGRRDEARWLLVGLGTVVLLAVVVLGVVAVKVAGRAGTTLEALFPRERIALEPGGGAALTVAPRTTVPRPELGALRGRPAASPVQIEESACAGPLRSGRLRPQTPGDWAGKSPARTAGELDDVAARTEIAAVMRRRFARDDPERAVREALQLYESSRLREVTGDVIPLRAGLAVLKGTLGEPVVRFVLTSDRPISIAFGNPLMPGAGAEAWGDGFTLSIVVRDEYRHEPGVVLAPLLFHELMHQNGQAQLPEEIVNNVLDIRLTIELMRDAPAAFARRSSGVDSLRFQTLIQLNSRVGTVLSVERADASSIIPDFGGPPVESFGAFLRSDDADEEGENLYSRLADAPSKGHPTLVEVLRMVAPGATVPDKMLFDRSAVELLDANAGVSLCDQLVAAEALRLVPRSPAQRAARTYLDNLTG